MVSQSFASSTVTAQGQRDWRSATFAAAFGAALVVGVSLACIARGTLPSMLPTAGAFLRAEPLVPWALIWFAAIATGLVGTRAPGASLGDGRALARGRRDHGAKLVALALDVPRVERARGLL